MNFLCRHAQWKLEFLPRGIHQCPRIQQNLKNLQNHLFTSSLSRYVEGSLEGPRLQFSVKFRSFVFRPTPEKFLPNLIGMMSKKTLKQTFSVYMMFLKFSSRDVKASFDRHEESFLNNCRGKNRPRFKRVHRL